MAPRFHPDGVVLRPVHRPRDVLALELGVLLGREGLVVVFHGSRQCIGGYAHLGGKLGHAVCLLHKAQHDVAVDLNVALADILAQHQEGGFFRLSQDGGGGLIAGGELVHEALAGVVHQDGPAAAHRLGDEDLGLSPHGRMDLDLLHVDHVSADLLRQCNTLAGSARLVRGGGLLELRLVEAYQLVVGGEAAGRIDHRLGLDGVEPAVLSPDLDAGNAPVAVGEDLHHLGVHPDVEVALCRVLTVHLDEMRAYRCAPHRTVGTVHGDPARAHQVGHVCAQGDQEIDRVSGLVREHLHEFRIVLVPSPFHGLLHHIGRVVVHPEPLLIAGPGRVDPARCQHAVAAGDGHLLEEDHLRPRVVGGDGSHVTRATRTDHHDIGRFGPRRLLVLCALGRFLHPLLVARLLFRSHGRDLHGEAVAVVAVSLGGDMTLVAGGTVGLAQVRFVRVDVLLGFRRQIREAAMAPFAVLVQRRLVVINRDGFPVTIGTAHVVLLVHPRKECALGGFRSPGQGGRDQQDRRHHQREYRSFVSHFSLL